MRVLYVEFVPGFGGSLTTLLDLIAALGRDVEPILVIPYDPRPYRALPPQIELRVVHPPSVPVGPFGRLSKLAHFARLTQKWARLLDDVVRETRPVLIHANNASGMNLAAGIVGRRRRIPVVSHQRDVEYQGWPNWLVLKSGVFSHHIACSHVTVRSLLDLGLPEDQCAVVYDPVAQQARSHRSTKENGQPLVVAMYSMLMPWKGQEVFLRAISEVYRRVERPFRTVVGGSEPFGANTYLARLKQLTTDLGLGPRVEFGGFTPDIYGQLAETDVLVLASLDPEPSGHIVQEAMACGVPVVVTDGGGASEFARSSEGGLVVPCRDVDAMAGAIERLLLDRDLRAECARRSLEYSRHAFNPVTIGGQVLSVYRACLNGA